MDTFFLLAFIVVTVILAVAIVWLIDGLPAGEARADYRASSSVLVALSLFGILLAFVGSMMGRIFPRGTFLVGDGIRRNASVVFWRRAVAGTFGLSLLASVVATLLTR
jgi:hypothetical protein